MFGFESCKQKILQETGILNSMYVITLLRTGHILLPGHFWKMIFLIPLVGYGIVPWRVIQFLLQNATLPETSSNRISQNEAGSSPKHPMLQAKLKIVSSTLCCKCCSSAFLVCFQVVCKWIFSSAITGQKILVNLSRVYCTSASS